MKFDTLNSTIPYVTGGKKHYFTETVYPGVEISMPGRHQYDTEPAGGDAVVLITDSVTGWIHHQFTHVDIFRDVELKATHQGYLRKEPFIFMENYLSVICGADPDKIDYDIFNTMPGLHPATFIKACQVLAIIEHRRYHMHEAKFGGRFLPFRYAAGIAERLWTLDEAAAKQRYGRGGVEQLERLNGIPELTRDLML